MLHQPLQGDAVNMSWPRYVVAPSLTQRAGSHRACWATVMATNQSRASGGREALLWVGACPGLPDARRHGRLSG